MSDEEHSSEEIHSEEDQPVYEEEHVHEEEPVYEEEPVHEEEPVYEEEHVEEEPAPAPAPVHVTPTPKPAASTQKTSSQPAKTTSQPAKTTSQPAKTSSQPAKVSTPASTAPTKQGVDGGRLDVDKAKKTLSLFGNPSPNRFRGAAMPLNTTAEPGGATVKTNKSLNTVGPGQHPWISLGGQASSNSTYMGKKKIVIPPAGAWGDGGVKKMPSPKTAGHK